MTFSLIGFGAEQLHPTPVQFQALSLGGALPVPPSQPYGTPNRDLVPVGRSGNPAVPANLTLAAQPLFNAILHVNPTVTGYANPGFAGAPNTTSGVGARNPSVAAIAVTQSSSVVVAGPSNTAPPQLAIRAGGTVTFVTSSPATTPVTIYAGTTVQTANGVQFNVLSNTVIQPGSSSANATVQAVNPGSSGNVAAGAIAQFAQNARPPAGVNVTNVTAFSNGADAGQKPASQIEQLANAVNATVVQIQNSPVNPLGVTVPQGQVSFSLTQVPAYVTSDAQALEQTVSHLQTTTSAPKPQPQLPPQAQQTNQTLATTNPANDPSHDPPPSTQSNQASPTPQPAVITSAPSFPPSSTPQYVQPANGSAVARIVQTVTQLAVSAIYPAPIFSFSA